MSKKGFAYYFKDYISRTCTMLFNKPLVCICCGSELKNKVGIERYYKKFGKALFCTRCNVTTTSNKFYSSWVKKHDYNKLLQNSEIKKIDYKGLFKSEIKKKEEKIIGIGQLIG